MRKVMIKTSCTWAGTEQEYEIEVKDDITDEELDDMAYLQALEDHGPEGWWEKIEDNDEPEDKATQ